MDPASSADPLLGRPVGDAGQHAAADVFLSMLGLLPQQGTSSGAHAAWESSGAAGVPGGAGYGAAGHPWALGSHESAGLPGQAQAQQARPAGFPAIARSRSNAAGTFGPARKQRENLPKQAVSILKKWL